MGGNGKLNLALGHFFQHLGLPVPSDETLEQMEKLVEKDLEAKGALKPGGIRVDMKKLKKLDP